MDLWMKLVTGIQEGFNGKIELMEQLEIKKVKRIFLEEEDIYNLYTMYLILFEADIELPDK